MIPIQPTVHVEPTDWNPCLIKMVWQRNVLPSDVRPAFKKITDYLDQNPEPVYVLVDITSNPKFPLAETMTHALVGPQRHKNLAGWLVIGSNPMAKLIERFLVSVTGRHIIYWFEDEQSVYDYLTPLLTGEKQF